jgi:hypothetical protein
MIRNFVALLSLGLLASSASAECTWVLWPKDLGGNFVQALLVYESRQQCENAQRKFIKSWDLKEQEQWRLLGAGRAHPSHCHCLPDSIDPRGPKR